MQQYNDDTRDLRIAELEQRVAELESIVRGLVGTRRPSSRRVNLEEVIRQRYEISADLSHRITTEVLLADLDQARAFPATLSPRSRAMALAGAMRRLGASRWTNGAQRGYCGVRLCALVPQTSETVISALHERFEITGNNQHALTPDELMSDLRIARVFPEGLSYDKQRDMLFSVLAQIGVRHARWKSGLGSHYLGIKRREVQPK